ncbi:Sec63 [Maudiozyma exigua]|uniref:DNA 3'-5' helicase n=1 Tax=Maudiozyma exigua TaxID=34358 RepID=A0A9P6WA65_MAUEX|nr:Sec63 [Kazachstania exigua]
MGTKFDKLGGYRNKNSTILQDEDPNSYSNFSSKRRGKLSHRKNSLKLNLSHNSLLDNEDENYSDSENIFGDNAFSEEMFGDSTNIRVDEDDTQVTGNTSLKHQTTTLTTNSKKKLKIRKNHSLEGGNGKSFSKKKLIAVKDIGQKFKKIFPFEYFNKMQSDSFEKIYETDENCVVSAPTGSGKTVLFELAILRYLSKFSDSVENKKILYIAPTKSLCSEITEQWKLKFSNLNVNAITGDTFSYEMDSIRKSQIIITTPEKWDLLTRKWTDYQKLFHLVQLLLVDEIHTIGEFRGATLEAVLTRMNNLCSGIRIIGVSATIPNIIDLALWLKKKDSDKMATILEYDDTYRQVKLEVHVKGYNLSCKNEFQRDAMYNQKLLDVIDQYSEDRPVLIFCPTRSSTINTAKYISNNTNINHDISENLMDRVLSNCMKRGVAFHNAGLALDDRSIVERSFLNGTTNILCATSTLAVGVNLPAYLVIIKGTQMWSVSELTEYSNLDTLQMIGRAGRPKFEKKGCAIIMTEPKMVSKYENLISGSDILESKLHLQLCEHMCSEISLGNINSLSSAVAWVKSTFFYVRFLKNRSAYHLLGGLDVLQGERSLNQFCQDLLMSLDENRIVDRDGTCVKCNSFGHAMVRHYISFGTISNIIKSKESLAIQEVLDIVVQSDEFKELRMRQNEKRLYKEINLSPLTRYPFLTQKKQSRIIDQTFQKVSLIIQYDLGGLEFPNYEGSQKLHHILVQDKIRIFKHCYRILRCMVDCFIEKKDGISLENSLFMLRSINGSCWEDSPMILRQIKSIGLVSVRKLVRNGITDFQELHCISDQKLEYYLGLKMGNGMKLRKDIDSLPSFSLNSKIEKQLKSGSGIEIILKIEVSSNSKTTQWHGKRLSLDISSKHSSGKLVDFRRIQLAQLQYPKSFKLRCLLSSQEDTIQISANCHEIAGLNKCLRLSAKDLSPSSSIFFEKSALDLSSSNTQHTILDDICSSSSDESLYNYLADKKTTKNSRMVVTSSNNARNNCKFFEGREQLPNGNYKCQHACNRKEKCRHLCCHEGIPKELIRKGKSTKAKVNPLKHSNNEVHNKNTFLVPNEIEVDKTQTEAKFGSYQSSHSGSIESLGDESRHSENTSDDQDSLWNHDPSKVSGYSNRSKNSTFPEVTNIVMDIETSFQDGQSDNYSVNLSFLGSDIELCN